MREKIGEMHSDMFKAMLGLNELPEPLLKQYFVIKKLLDKIDGRLSAADLIRIAMDVGLNPETVRFETKVLGTNEQGFVVEREVASADPEPEPEPEPETDRVALAAKPPETLNLEPGLAAATDDDDEIDPANPDYGDGEVEEVADEPEPEADDEPLYKLGSEVQILEAGEVLDGKIVGFDGDKYVFEAADGETYEVFEEDIEV